MVTSLLTLSPPLSSVPHLSLLSLSLLSLPPPPHSLSPQGRFTNNRFVKSEHLNGIPTTDLAPAHSF